MTIQQLLDGAKVNWIHVKILEKVSPTQYVVGDSTGLAIMEIDPNSNHDKYIKVGKVAKLVKPSKITADVIACDKRFNPMKTKPIILAEIDQGRMDHLKTLHKTTCHKMDDIDFETIENDYQDNSIINKKILMYVVSVSRAIDGTYGQYRICNIRDKTSHPLTLSLYAPHVDKLQDNQVYSMTKLKKNILKSDGSVRLGTTKYSQIQKVTQIEEELFKDIQIADNVVNGCCIMYTNLSSYNSCPKHMNKLDEDGECPSCKTKINQEDAKLDFHCLLQIEDNVDSTLKSILIFRRHTDMKTDINETEIEEFVEEQYVGNMLQVHYNTPDEDNNIAVKVVMTA